MNIFDDIVTSHSFDSAIQSEIQKSSQEYRVLATLRYLFPDDYHDMVKDERPDLQDKKNEVGIEVTLAVKGDEMKAGRAFANYCDNPSSPKSKSERRSIEEMGYSIEQSQFGDVLTAPLGSSAGEKTIFQESIRRKIKKAKDYRNKFPVLGLAVLLPEIPTSEAEERFGEWAFELLQPNDPTFDFVYVISERFCQFLDIKTRKKSKHTISKEENFRLCKIARMTAEGKISPYSSVWTQNQ